MNGWLVNDTLTCIPGTKTMWHDLLDWLPDLEDAVKGRIDFPYLAYSMENKALAEGPPDYVIRNGTFFRPMRFKTRTISLLQDIYSGPLMAEQVEVGQASNVVVYNSEYTKSFYSKHINTPSKIIPLGVDFDHFCPTEETYPEVLPNSILFVGAANDYPKGFNIVRELVETTGHNFCLVMKDGFQWDHPKVKVFNQVNHSILRKIYNSCSIILCTSVHETQHLAGIEGAACGLPVIATNVGVYHNGPDGKWGHRVSSSAQDFAKTIEIVIGNLGYYNPREYFLKKGLDKLSCMKEWKRLVGSIKNERS